MSENRRIPGARRWYGSRLYASRRRPDQFTPILTVTFVPFARPRLAVTRWHFDEWVSSSGNRLPAHEDIRIGPVRFAYTYRVVPFVAEWE